MKRQPALDPLRPLPVNTAPEGVRTKLLAVAVPAELADGLERQAAAEGMSPGALLTFMISEYLAKNDPTASGSEPDLYTDSFGEVHDRNAYKKKGK